METQAPKEFNLYSPEHYANPYLDYAEMRQVAPFYPVKGYNNRRIWIVTRYEDIQAIFKDPRFVKDVRTVSTPEEIAAMNPSRAFRILGHNMLGTDPPDHTRLRSLISKAFTPRRVEQLQPRIEQITDELLDGLAEQTEVELINSFAFILPIRVICELMGIPESNSDQFRQWAKMLFEGEGPADSYEKNSQAGALHFVEYLTELVTEKRNSRNASASNNPNEAKDLVTALIDAAEEQESGKLDEDELIAMLWLLIIAGHETTVNLIGNGLLALFQHPDQLELLKKQPELMKTAIEEFLRYDGPAENTTLRFAAEDLELNGQKFLKGEGVVLVLAGADRDPEIFAQPDDLDITRTSNPHLAFGYGIHYCIGAPLARLEGQIAFRKLLERKPNIHLAVPVEELQWRRNPLVRALKALPVAF